MRCDERLRCVLEDGALRWITLQLPDAVEREVVRGVYAAVRDHNWVIIGAVLPRPSQPACRWPVQNSTSCNACTRTAPGTDPERGRGHAVVMSYDPTIYQGAAAHYRLGRPD